MLKIFERILTKFHCWSCPVCFENRFKNPRGVSIHIGKTKDKNHIKARIKSWRT